MRDEPTKWLLYQLPSSIICSILMRSVFKQSSFSTSSSDGTSASRSWTIFLWLPLMFVDNKQLQRSSSPAHFFTTCAETMSRVDTRTFLPSTYHHAERLWSLNGKQESYIGSLTFHFKTISPDTPRTCATGKSSNPANNANCKVAIKTSWKPKEIMKL